MESIMLPIGIRRDGSFYTRIEWASTTESDPAFWVCNLICDDVERNGGTYGANSGEKTDVVLSFFGERQRIAKARIYKNVGVDTDAIEELAKNINIYVNDTDEPQKLRNKEDDISSVGWNHICSHKIKKELGWEEIVFDRPVSAKYVRAEMVGNFCEKDKVIPWIELGEIKLYPTVN